jgi:hypothetical protein
VQYALFFAQLENFTGAGHGLGQEIHLYDEFGFSASYELYIPMMVLRG